MPSPPWAARAPGVPSITVLSGSSAINKTTGRAEPPVIVRITPGSGTVPVHHYVVTLTPSGDTPQEVEVLPAEMRAQFDGLAVGTEVSVEAKAVNAFDVESDPCSPVAHTVSGRSDLPANPTGLTYLGLADGTREYRWSIDPAAPPEQAAKIVGFQVRAGLGSGLEWDDLIPINEAVHPSTPINSEYPLTSGLHTIGVASVDRYGRACLTPALTTATLGVSSASRKGRLDFSNPGQSGQELDGWL